MSSLSRKLAQVLTQEGRKAGLSQKLAQVRTQEGETIGFESEVRAANKKGKPAEQLNMQSKCGSSFYQLVL